MRISRIEIQNYRNFRHLEVRLDNCAVVVGENRIGKSNLVSALRLVLDPTLPDAFRQLRLEDFWDGLGRPLPEGARVRVSVDIADFEDDANLVALLCDYLVEPEPMVSRLTYEFRPRGNLADGPCKASDYEWVMYGGDDVERRVDGRVRRWLPLELLPALRDAEGDLENWRRSPLRPLLNRAADEITEARMAVLAAAVDNASQGVAAEPEIGRLAATITSQIANMVGEQQALDAALRFTPSDATRLLRALRLYVDDGRRLISDASLGSANIVYLALRILELGALVEDGDRLHTVMAVEEPEAHLHPHLQRLVYRDFLRTRGLPTDEHHRVVDRARTTILLTTHSPHIVSVAPLRALVLLKRDPDDGSTRAASTAQLTMPDEDVADLERYLDVTRGELLFARGVLLVEGDAEEYLVPALAKAIGYDLDALGISVCSVSGTNFRPYVKLVGPNGLDIPFALITDMDPDGSTPLALGRVRAVLKHLLGEAAVKERGADEVWALGEENGVFVNSHTLEIDLWREGNGVVVAQTIAKLAPRETIRKRAEDWEAGEEPDPTRLLADIGAIGKGRVAQRLALHAAELKCPSYIRKAIEHVAKRVH